MLLLAFFLFVVGLFVGSFLLVVIDRLPREESIIKGRSHCEHCSQVLGIFDLIPLLSFLLLGGKCRYCHKNLSWYYPFVEFITAVAFASIVLAPVQYTVFSMQYIVTLLYLLFVVSSFIVILFTDIKYGIIPDKVTFLAIVITLLYLLLFSPENMINHILAGVGAFLFFYLIHYLTRGRGMGFGDVKLVLWLGLLVGFPQIALALYLSFILGAIVAVVLIMCKRKKFKGSTIPFGPFLVISSYIVVLYGDILVTIIRRYLEL